MPYQKPTVIACDPTTENACCCGGTRIVFGGTGVRQNPDGSYTVFYDLGFGGSSQAHCECQ